MQRSDWTFGPVSSVMCGSLLAILLAVGYPVVGYPDELPVALGLTATGITWLVGRRRRIARGNVYFRMACWLLPTCWIMWVIKLGWSWTAVAVLIVAALAAGLLAPIFGHEAPYGLQAPPLFQTSGDLKQEWTERINKIAKIEAPGVFINNLDAWPGNSGYSLHGVFPAESGYTWTAIRDVGDRLAAAKHLPVGCPVTAEVGTHQGGFVVHVPTVNGLAEDLPFPNLAPRSVRDPFSIGQFLDRRPTEIELYQSAGLIAGERGGGKTVLLQNITGNLAYCTDAVVWHIDLNGGGMSAPWIYPWATGRADYPVVDWVAGGGPQETDGDRERAAQEALVMAEVGLAIARDRKARYQHLLIQNNTDVLPVSAGIPEIIIIVDEGGEVTGAEASKTAQKAAAKLRELQRIGRAMCVNVVFSMQRATADYLPSQMKKNAKMKVCMTVQDDAEIAHLLDWNRGLRAADLLYPGCGYIRRNTREIPRQFKGYLLKPAQIADIAVATAPLRPVLDEPAIAIGGKVYAQRWDRAAAWLAILRGEVVEREDLPSPVPVSAGDSGDPPVGSEDRTRAVIERLRAQRGEVPQQSATVPDWVREAQAGLADLPVAEPVRPQRREATGAEPSVPETSEERKLMLHRLLVAAGPNGMKTAEIIAAVAGAGVKVSDWTVKNWLAQLRDEGRARQLQQGVWVGLDGQAA